MTKFLINKPKIFVPSFLNSLAHCFLLHSEIVFESNSQHNSISFSFICLIDIILLTQGLPDHCHIPTLEMFRKDIPIICPKSAVETLKKIGFSSIKVLKPTEKTNYFNLSFEATAGAPVPQTENGYIVKDDQDNGFYIEPHGYLDENLNKQSLDAVITPTKNLELPLVGSFVKGADVIPKLINKFNPKFILSSTVGGDAKYSGFLNNFISVKDYEEELNCNLVDLKSMQSIVI